jgi:predicted transport protein
LWIVRLLKESELEERIARAAGFSTDGIMLDPAAKGLFTILRPCIQALGSDVVELPNQQSVVYAVYDLFVEVIPRKHRLSLLLNLDFDSLSDPSGKASDASEYAFVVNASETGGVLFSFDAPTDLDAAMHLIRQAYEAAAE